MHYFPFAVWSGRRQHQQRTSDTRNTRKPTHAQAAIAYTGKKCMLCTESNAPFDLWHVLFECDATRDHPLMVRTRRDAQLMVARICNLLRRAAVKNSEGPTTMLGSGHVSKVPRAAKRVEAALEHYQWECIPGRWLTYMLILALPFPRSAVRPPETAFLRKRVVPKLKTARQRAEERARAANGENDGTPRVPVALPVPATLPDTQYRLPEAFGALMDAAVLPKGDLRRTADVWLVWSKRRLMTIGRVTRPLRRRAEAAREAARATETAGTAPHREESLDDETDGDSDDDDSDLS
jgi:hypothetical protein